MFEQDRVLVRLRQQITRDKQIQVCFLTGSYGRGTRDEFSDLDLVLVYEDEERLSNAYQRRTEFVSTILPFVPVRSYDADHIRPFLHSALYGNGAKVDFQYAAMNKLQPAEYFRKIMLIKDTSDEWGRNLQVSSERLAPTVRQENISSDELIKLDDIFWVLFMEVYRQIQRGERHRPFTTYLFLLNTTIPWILNLLPTEDPSRRSLARSIYDDDTAITLQFLRQLLNNYIEARRKIVNQFNLDFPLESPFERDLKKIVSAR